MSKKEGSPDRQTSYRWVVLSVVWLAFGVSSLARFNLDPLLPFIKLEMKLTMTQCGLFTTATWLGYLLMQLPAGIATDRYGVKKVLSFLQVLTGIFSILAGFASSYFEAVILRFLIGLGAGCVFAPSSRAIRWWFSKSKRATAMSIFVTAPPTFRIIGGVLFPWVAIYSGWRLGFFISGIVVLSSGLYTFVLAKNVVTPYEFSLSERRRSTKSCSVWTTFSRDMYLIILAGIFLSYVFAGVMAFFYSYLVFARGFAEIDAGFVLAALSLASVVSSVCAGYVSDITGRRKPLILASLIFLFLSLSLLGVETERAFVIALGIVIGFVFMVWGLLATLVIEKADQEYVGTLSGFANSVWKIGSVVSPAIFGLIVDTFQSWMLGWLNLAFAALLATLALVGVKERA